MLQKNAVHMLHPRSLGFQATKESETLGIPTARQSCPVLGAAPNHFLQTGSKKSHAGDVSSWILAPALPGENT